MREHQHRFSGALSDRRQNETVSPQRTSLPIDKKAIGRFGRTVRSVRTAVERLTTRRPWVYEVAVSGGKKQSLDREREE